MRPIRNRLSSAPLRSCSDNMIYIHVPYCRSFCTYCSFYSEVAKGECGTAYAEAVCAEAAARAEEIAESADVNTLYIGGGTPSVLPLSVLGRMVSALPEASYDEFTVEVNPEDIVEKGQSYAEGLKALGVNRVSMGVQSFDDGILKWMNRRHDAAGAVRAFEILRAAGIGNISIDLIFGLSQLSDELWNETLGKAVALGPEHISAYQLSVEDGSALASMIERGQYSEAPEEQCRRQYDVLCRRLAEAGFTHYEVSNFARPGYEARHNSAYWRRVPYVGLGPGAHSLRGDVRSWNSETTPSYESEKEVLTEEDVRMERIMLGLRTAAGMDAEELRRSSGEVGRLVAEGALEAVRDRIRIPENRFFVSDEIIRELI